ncbi:hypothetical protein L198_05165 [Cryptococcus wingfieldii CBS 7118]|uniref:Spindle pole body component n=1 Tax=Cryptococcus wingfieldii CBS 7118 TaxID=1295528 RepID=A0A1E3J0D0_9TREE|nr:hypothetical protein L198_05165 [Cryptococcus wingfieldii CBS 7118]ODN94309.1 hypothetical protein L198_05165 [Cryptococcus wingfieldii CBS 7118]
MAAPASMFQLAQLSLEEQHLPLSLPVIDPQFHLPELDEFALGTERLVGSLRGSSGYALQDRTKIPPWNPSETGDYLPEGLPSVGTEKDGEEELWQKLAEEPLAESQAFHPLRTWDPSETNFQTAFLSEGSTATFDAVLTSLEPPIQLPSLKSPLPPPAHDSVHLLDLMMRATLGTVTTEHLLWDAKRSKYGWKESGGRPIGMERITFSRVVEEFLSIATAIRRLELIINSQSLLPLTPTHHALLHAMSTYLTYIRERLMFAISQCEHEGKADWNKWILATRDVNILAQTLCEVMKWPLTSSRASALPTRASSLLSHLYSHLFSALSVCPTPTHSIPIALAFLFSESSGPWMSTLHAWLGLVPSDEEDDTDAKSQPWGDLGITRAKVNDRWQYDFSSKHMPVFVPREARRVLFEAGKSLRILREASNGQHPLCSTEKWDINVQWSWGDDNESGVSDIRGHLKRVRKEVECWKRSQRGSLSGSLSGRKTSRRERKGIPLEFRAPPSTSPPAGFQGEADPESEMERFFALLGQAPGSHLSAPPKKEEPDLNLWAQTPLETLHRFISRHSSPDDPLLPQSCPTLPIFVSDYILAPLTQHAGIVSASLVSLYLDDLRFLDHLDVLRAFWLGGDVDFMERAGGALFGKDSAGAGEAAGLGKRARTRARLGLAPGNDAGERSAEWGIGLGIGLSERSRWPPGGAELAYALRTTLMHDDIGGMLVKENSSVWQEVEDRVSFAIKELPEEGDTGRRARWLNPQAIEALDFLYLAYSPDPIISTLLPPLIMVKYQSVHNLLLRLSRVDLVLRTMYWDVVHQSESFDEPLKMGVDSGINRPPRAARFARRERIVHSLFPKGSQTERHLQSLRFKMSHFVNTFGRYVMDSAISIKWNAMRKRLGKLQQKIPGKDESRPGSPVDDDDGLGSVSEDEGQTDDDESEDNPASLRQLQSIHSLVAYHNLSLDRILRACLLGPQAGQQVTYKVLTTLFGLILDLGKTLKEVEKGFMGWEDGAEKVEEIMGEWAEKEAVFMHALERLSLRTTSSKRYHTEGGDQTEQDMLLLEGEGEGAGVESEADYWAKLGMGGNDLQELVLRLRLRGSTEGKGGRWKKENLL